MQFAIVDNNRHEAFPSGRGVCPSCGCEVIAKCGPKLIHHWAHHRSRNCDPWWENETAWHRNWKNLFPAECREVVHHALDGEIHRADVKSPSGIFIEFQHSFLTDKERESREEFYRNLVWVIDGSRFIQNFDIYHPLPDPKSELAEDIIWSKSRRHYNGSIAGVFFRLSEARKENPLINKADVRGGRVHFMEEIHDKVMESYNGYHQYDWIRPHGVWLSAKCPVYIDFGERLLVKLEVYGDYGLSVIRYVSKRKFVHDAMTETTAGEIASRFYNLGDVAM